jgi:hypothetical protein
MIGCIALAKTAFTDHSNNFRVILFILSTVGYGSAVFMLAKIRNAFEGLDRDQNLIHSLRVIMRLYVWGNVMFLIMSLVLMYASRTHLI